MIKLVKAASIVLLAICLGMALNCSASEAKHQSNKSNEDLLKLVQSVEGCFITSISSFLYPVSYPPTTSKQFEEQCKNRTESFQCVKDAVKKKKFPALISRGLSSIIGHRIKFDRKYCKQISSPQTKRLISTSKCVMDNYFKKIQKIDQDIASDYLSILSNKLATKELKYFCCFTIMYRRNIINQIEPSVCPNSRDIWEEVIRSTVVDEISTICDDDDKSIKECQQLKPLTNRVTFNASNPNQLSPSVASLFILATLGERE